MKPSTFGQHYDTGVQARRLRSAFLWSLLLHALLLGLGEPPRRAEEVKPLVVFIRPAPAVPATVPAPGAQGVPARGTLITTAAGTAPPAPETPGAAATVAADPLPAARDAGSGGGAEETEASLDPDDVRQYRVSLGGAMGHVREYPAEARRRGWQGRVELHLSLQDGRPPVVRVDKSSGHGLLDERARRMLLQAVAVTPRPASLQGRDFVLPLVVVFELEGE